MSLVSQINGLTTRVGTEFKAIRSTLGALTSLTTTEKSTIVGAINEVNAKTANAGAQINDASPSTTQVYSSSKTNSVVSDAVATVKADILGGAGPTVDTLKEIADKLAASDTEDDSAIAALTTAVANRVRVDAAQSFTNAQTAQARSNIGAQSAADIGDTTTDFVAVFNTALT